MMRKRGMAAALLLCMVCVLTGCGNKVTIADLKGAEVEKYVTLPDYKNLEVQKPSKVEITDAYVNSYINSQVDAVSELRELTGTVENGDVVNIDYAGTIDGTAFEGGTAQSQLLEIGSGSFIEGFEEGLVGANVGETKELPLQFPDNYRNADVAGKECVFAVKINYILSEVTDENVNLVDAGYQSAAQYREDAGNMLRGIAEFQYEKELKSYLATSLVAGCTYEEVPKTLAEDYRTSLQTDFENAAAAAGVSLEQYMASTYYISADNMESELDAMALRCAKEGLALQAIANAEGISVSDEELDAALDQYAAPDDAADEAYRENVRVNLMYDKVYDFLVGIYTE